MARGDYESEPDSLLQKICPYCATWFTKDQVDNKHRELTVRKGRVVEVLYCDSVTHERVELKDAAAIGELTPWQEWKRDRLILEMEQHSRKVEALKRELYDYYLWDGSL